MIKLWRRNLLGLLGLLALTTPLSAAVLVVGTGGSFTDIQPAVNMARDGDIVLVRTGTYGPVAIDDLSLTIVADVELTSNQGSVRIEQCAVTGFGGGIAQSAQKVLDIVDCSDVALTETTLLQGGPAGLGSNPIPSSGCSTTSNDNVGPSLDIRAGSDNLILQTPRGLTMQSPAREFENISLDFSGSFLDTVGVFWGFGPANYFKPKFNGHVLLDSSL